MTLIEVARQLRYGAGPRLWLSRLRMHVQSYERRGLLPRVRRDERGHREFSPADVAVIRTLLATKDGRTPTPWAGLGKADRYAHGSWSPDRARHCTRCDFTLPPFGVFIHPIEQRYAVPPHVCAAAESEVSA